MQIYELVSYEQLGQMLVSLTTVIRIRFKYEKPFDFIYAPMRGGLPVAVHLSHHLGVPKILLPADVTAINIPPLKYPEVNRILFVDDIVDRGDTLEQFHRKVERKAADGWAIKTVSCSLFAKPRASTKPDIFIRMVPDNTWVVFPWERRCDAEECRSEYDQRQASN